MNDKPPVKSYCGGKPNYCTPEETHDVDNVDISEECVHKTDKSIHEPVGFVSNSGQGAYILSGVDLEDDTPLYTAPPKKKWVGLTDEEVESILEQHNEAFPFAVYQSIEMKLKEKNT